MQVDDKQHASHKVYISVMVFRIVWYNVTDQSVQLLDLLCLEGSCLLKLHE